MVKIEEILSEGWDDVQHYRKHKSKKCKRCMETKRLIDKGKSLNNC